jgi:hypothetical protein
MAMVALHPPHRTVFSLLGALLFSAYIVFDTHMLIARNGIDEYVWTSVRRRLYCMASTAWPPLEGRSSATPPQQPPALGQAFSLPVAT